MSSEWMNHHWALILAAVFAWAMVLGGFLTGWHWMKKQWRDGDQQ
jgi:hypothetical protein